MIPYVNDPEKNQFDDPQYIKTTNVVKWQDRVLLNRPSKVIAALIITSVALPVLLYHFKISATLELTPSDGYSFGSCLLPRGSRIPCGGENVTMALCHRECCFDLAHGLCFHRLPSRFSYVTDGNWTEDVDLRPRVTTEPFASQTSLRNLRLSIDEVSRSHLILSFYNSTDTWKTGARLTETDYSYTVSTPELNVQVDAFERTLFSTMRGPLIASENVWEVTFKLTNESMYGLGEIPIIKDNVKIIYSHRGNSASIPLIYAKTNESYHGLLIDVETPTEVSVRGDNMVVVRSMAMDELRFHLFVGPEPKDVMRDVMTVVGAAEPLPYWMLGAHVCHNDPELTLEESHTKFLKFLIDAESADLPYESHCGSSQMILNNQAENNQALETSFTYLSERNKKLVPHLSPFIRYYVCNETETDANDAEAKRCDLNNNFEDYKDIFLRSMDIYIGTAHGYNVIYPDYQNKTSTELLRKLWNFNGSLGGVVLTDNWPLDDSPKYFDEMYSQLPLFNSYFKMAFEDTPPWDLIRPNGLLHFHTHNSYGNHFYSTMKEFTQNIPLLSTSQWMNGQANIDRQNVEISWAKYRDELLEVALSSVSGNWYISTPICGDQDDFDATSQTALCVKWYQMSTYMPLIKIQSKTAERYPHTFTGTTRINMMNALKTRQSLLPYLYTVLSEGPLLRPMFYQFPEEQSLANLTTQFSVGDSLLIVPDLLPSQSSVNVWMPPGTWYEFWSGLRIEAEDGQAVQMAGTDADFLTLIRGGSVIFMQKDTRPSAEETRLHSSYSITIALECVIENAIETCNASGKLYLTPNMSLTAESNGISLTLTGEGDDFKSLCDPELAISASHIAEITIYGLRELNNYDHFRRVDVSVDMCRLAVIGEIVVTFEG